MFKKKDNKQEITVSLETIVRVIVVVGLTLFAFQILENLLHPLTLIFVSFFLAMALNPVVTKLSKMLKIKSRTLGTAVAYLSVISLLTLFFSLILPPLVSQTTDFITNLPETVDEIQQSDSALGRFARDQEIDQQISDFVSEWTQDASRVSNSAVSVANRIVANLISIITVLILTFMMLVEGPKWIALFWRYYPSEKRKHHQRLAQRMYEVVINYVNGQVIVSAIGSMFAMITLAIMTRIFGVDSLNVIALGGIVFIFSLIPTIGTILGSALVILFAMIASLPMAIAVLIYFIVYQQIENSTIQPIIQSRGSDLTPMLVFIAAIIGIGFGGLLGAIIAIPAAGCMKILIEDWIENRNSEK